MRRKDPILRQIRPNACEDVSRRLSSELESAVCEEAEPPFCSEDPTNGHSSIPGTGTGNSPMKAPSSRPSGSNPPDVAVLFMSSARVDELLNHETAAVAKVATGAMSQHDRFDVAIQFFHEVIASAYLITSAVELGCKTVGEAGRRFGEVRARAEHQLGFDPLAALDRISVKEAGRRYRSDEPLLTVEWIRNFVSSVLAWTELETLLTEAHLRQRAHEMLGLHGKLTGLLRRIDAFCEQRMLILSEKYVLGEITAAQCAEILGVDGDEATARLRQPRSASSTQWRAYRPADEDEAMIRAGVEDSAKGATVDLTPDELATWEATGELPASVEARFAGCG